MVFKEIKGRISYFRLKYDIDTIILKNAYELIGTAAKEGKDEFFDQIGKVFQEIPYDTLIFLGDFKADIGKEVS